MKTPTSAAEAAAVYNYNNIAINTREIKQVEEARGLDRVIVCNRVKPNNVKEVPPKKAGER